MYSACTKTHVGDCVSLWIQPHAMHTLMIAMMSDAPSSTPRIGRNESDRYSKNESSHATLPRALERAAALTSAFDMPSVEPPAALAGAPDATRCISGRFMIWL